MKKISSNATFFGKRVLMPLLAVAFLVVMVLAYFDQDVEATGGYAMWLATIVIFALVAFLNWRQVFGGVVDEVHDAGSSLLIKNSGEQVKVQLEDIVHLNHQLQSVELRLRDDSRFGGAVKFLPKGGFTFNPFAKNAVVEDLIVRIDQAKLDVAK